MRHKHSKLITNWWDRQTNTDLADLADSAETNRASKLIVGITNSAEVDVADKPNMSPKDLVNLAEVDKADKLDTGTARKYSWRSLAERQDAT